MYLIYIDESGKNNLIDNENYVVGAFIIKEDQWQFIDREVKLLKSKGFPSIPDDEIEFHASDISHKRKRFINFTQSDTFNLFEDIYTLISNQYCVLIASVIRKEFIYSYIKKKEDINDWIEKKGYMILFERICLYLDKVNQAKESINEPIDYGILIIDSINKYYDQLLRKKIIAFLEEGTDYVKNKYLIEDPIFVSSKYRNLIQLADFIPFIVRRKYRISSKITINTQNYEKYFEIIKGKFDTCKNGQLIGCGIKCYPK